jgi:hypothetical protein
MSIETVEYRGYKIEIDTDDDHISPRDDENLGTMICFHNRYQLGDKNIEKFDIEDIKKIADSKDYISLPLYLYDHSGITMNTGGFSCKWDSGQVGLIFVSKEKVRNEYGWKNLTTKRVKKIESYLKGEVETYDYFITGQVYSYKVEEDDIEDEDSINECCGGFLGYDHEKSGLLEYARNAIDCHIKYKEEEKKKEEINNGIQLELELV